MLIFLQFQVGGQALIDAIHWAMGVGPNKKNQTKKSLT
jgi:hypothetical protein